MTEMWDVFICHASEDKDTVARPLAEALQKKGLRIWYDEYTLKMGDSLRRTIDRGLRESKYGIVILSQNFFAKEWPQKELDGLAAREIDGKKVILPIWHDLTREDVLRYSPMLADRLAAKTKDGMGHVVDMVMEVFGESAQQSPQGQIINDKIVRIEADRDSFIIGGSVLFSGISANCGDHVYLNISGPGEFSKGKEVASPQVSASGIWRSQWSPGSSILPGLYTISVFDSEKKISDEVLVKAEKGSVTIMAQGDGSYYVGEKIRLSGTCTSGNLVYLSLKGPNAAKDEKKLDHLLTKSQNGDPNTFVRVNVRNDHTWSYVWDTATVAFLLKEGFYRIYAIESPFTSDNLFKIAYGTVTVIIKNPFISATVSQSTVVVGDRLFINGTAEGVRNQELLIWIFGESFTHLDKIYTNPDASFLYEIPPIITKILAPGQYFAIIQHPMMNNEFDVYFDDNKQNVFVNHPNRGTLLFSIQGEGIYQGFNAMNLVIDAFNNPNVDDSFTTLSFLVESPIIRFDRIGDKRKGAKFTVTATTNLAIGDQIFIEVYSSICVSDPTKKVDSVALLTGIVGVTKGDAGLNKISFDLDTSPMKSDEYVIKASAMDLEANASTFFNVIEK